MMTKESDFADYCLPTDLLTDDFFAAEEKISENDGDEETLHLLNHSFLHGDRNVNPEPSVMATSPQSTLCGVGNWSFNSNGGSPDGNSLVSSPPSTPPFQAPRDDALLDLLHAAAGQVEGLSLDNRTTSRAVPPAVKSTDRQNQRSMGFVSNQDLIQQQLQAARFFQLKRQQLLKLQQQHLHAVCGRRRQQLEADRSANAAADKATPLGLSSSAWPPLQKQSQQQQVPRGSGMTAVFLNGGGRKSTGTGVFLPRRGWAPAEPRKKSACSTVLLPARVVQALNLNLEDMEVHPRAPNCYVLDGDVMMGRSKMKRSQATAQATAGAAVGSSPVRRLPQEWTY